jgi:predicted nucleotidyltransferase
MMILHILEANIPPPSRYPDFYPALFAIYSAGNFLLAYLYSIRCLWMSSYINTSQRMTSSIKPKQIKQQQAKQPTPTTTDKLKEQKLQDSEIKANVNLKKRGNSKRNTLEETELTASQSQNTKKKKSKEA